MAEEKIKFSSFVNHIKNKTKLVSPFNQLNMESIKWERDFLPEHLWIELLFNEYPEDISLKFYNDFLDALDKYYSSDEIIFGFISDFGLINIEKRSEFISKYEDIIYSAFYKPISRIMAFYPESPCYWLINEKYLQQGGPLDPNIELNKLGNSIRRLMPGKDLHAGHIRTLPITRLFVHNKIGISSKMQNKINLLKKYKIGCNEEEQYEVQQFARTIMNIELQRINHYKSREWPIYFWNHNIDIAPCMKNSISQEEEFSLEPAELQNIINTLKKNCQLAIDYLSKIALRYRPNLYDPSRDEIIMGLFSRLTRLFIYLSINTDLWCKDIGNIILRCLTETAITFTYLAKKGSDEDFKNFISYSEGKEKTLLLHLQDTYPEKKSIEGLSSEDIANRLGGGLTPELINIELDNWTKKSCRDLAMDSGMEEFYRIIFDPTSSDVHGSWTSIKDINLIRCAQPLHRYHRIPNCANQPLHIDFPNIARRIFLNCIQVGIDYFGFPILDSSIEEIRLSGLPND